MPAAPLSASVLLALGLSTAAADSGQDTGADTGSKDAELQVCLCAVIDGSGAAAVLAGAVLLAARRREAGPDREAARDTVLKRGVLPDDVAATLRR